MPHDAETASGQAERRAWSIPRGSIVLLTAAAAVVTIAGIRSLAGIVAPTFLALMLTISMHPVQEWAARKRWPTWAGMLAAVLAVYTFLLALVVALVVTTAQLASVLPDYAEDFDDLLSGVRSSLAAAGVNDFQIQNLLRDVDLAHAVAFLESALRGILSVVSNLLFVLALLLFMAVDGMNIGRKLDIIGRLRPDIRFALTTFTLGTRRYLTVSTTFGLIVAVFDGTALWIMGVPLPLAWAVLSFITNYIPNIGFVLGVIPPALLALLEGGPSLMVWVIVVYSVINFVIQSIIQPKFVGDAVGITVTMTFLALVFWSWVLGPLGAILAIPLTLFAKSMLLDIDPATRWANVLVSDMREPEPEPLLPPAASPLAVAEDAVEAETRDDEPRA
ncbi:AI-2E family transporter [Rhodococcus sp. HNM0569]|uniref:AI-2E family transporter n=1 Tax=Rhodococcus sp. HNM0569 TaxID=2716340 RepID=UPI003211E2A7